MLRDSAEPAPVRPCVNVLRPSRLAPQPAMYHRERKPRPKARDKHGRERHRVVVAAVTPTEDINAIALYLGQRRRFGKFVSHPNKLRATSGENKKS